MTPIKTKSNEEEEDESMFVLADGLDFGRILLQRRHCLLLLLLLFRFLASCFCFSVKIRISRLNKQNDTLYILKEFLYLI